MTSVIKSEILPSAVNPVFKLKSLRAELAVIADILMKNDDKISIDRKLLTAEDPPRQYISQLVTGKNTGIIDFKKGPGEVQVRCPAERFFPDGGSAPDGSIISASISYDPENSRIKSIHFERASIEDPDPERELSYGRINKKNREYEIFNERRRISFWIDSAENTMNSRFQITHIVFDIRKDAIAKFEIRNETETINLS